MTTITKQLILNKKLKNNDITNMIFSYVFKEISNFIWKQKIIIDKTINIIKNADSHIGDSDGIWYFFANGYSKYMFQGSTCIDCGNYTDIFPCGYDEVPFNPRILCSCHN